MTGKEKCRILRKIRETIALQNDIPYETVDCPNEGDCKGTCPRCEMELVYLERRINEKAQRGETICLDGISLEALGVDDEDVSEINDENDLTGCICVDRPKDTITPNPFEYTKIDVLDLSPRSLNCLKRANIYTLGDLMEKIEELPRVSNLGRRSVLEIIDKLEEHGYLDEFLQAYDCESKDDLINLIER